MSVHLNSGPKEFDDEINRQVEKFSRQRKEIISRVKMLLSRITVEPVYPKKETASTYRKVEKRNSGEIMKSQASLLQEELLRASQQRGRKNVEPYKKKLIEERKKIFSHQELLLSCQKRNPIDISQYEAEMRERKREKALLKTADSLKYFDLKLIEKKQESCEKKETIDSSWNDSEEFFEENSHLDDYEEIKSRRETIINEAVNRPISRSVSMYTFSSDETNKKHALASYIRNMLINRRKNFSSDEES